MQLESAGTREESATYSGTRVTSFSGVRAVGRLCAYPSNLQPPNSKRRQDVLENPPDFFLGPSLLTEVELGDLKKVGKEIAESLGQRLDTNVDLKGKVIIVPDTAAGRRIGVKDVKMQLKHVLHHLSLSKDYRVLSEQHKVKIVRVEEKTRHEVQKGTPPPATESLPYFFPGR